MKVGHISVPTTYDRLWDFLYLFIYFFIPDVIVFGLQKRNDRNKHWIFTLLFHGIDFTAHSHIGGCHLLLK